MYLVGHFPDILFRNRETWPHVVERGFCRHVGAASVGSVFSVKFPKPLHIGKPANLHQSIIFETGKKPKLGPIGRFGSDFHFCNGQTGIVLAVTVELLQSTVPVEAFNKY